MRMRDDAGAATLAAVVMSLAVLVGVAVAGQLTRAAVAQHRAEAAADLAALSAATAVLGFEAAPCEAAALTARSNEAEMVACSVSRRADGPLIDVTVRNRHRVWPVAAATASARSGLREAPAMWSARAPAWPP